MAVVDQFEAVEVDHVERHGAAGTLGVGEISLQLREEQRAVGNSRQQVVLSQPAILLLAVFRPDQGLAEIGLHLAQRARQLEIFSRVLGDPRLGLAQLRRLVDQQPPLLQRLPGVAERAFEPADVEPRLHEIIGGAHPGRLKVDRTVFLPRQQDEGPFVGVGLGRVDQPDPRPAAKEMVDQIDVMRAGADGLQRLVPIRHHVEAEIVAENPPQVPADDLAVGLVVVD